MTDRICSMFSMVTLVLFIIALFAGCQAKPSIVENATSILEGGEAPKHQNRDKETTFILFIGDTLKIPEVDSLLQQLSDHLPPSARVDYVYRSKGELRKAAIESFLAEFYHKTSPIRMIYVLDGRGKYARWAMEDDEHAGIMVIAYQEDGDIPVAVAVNRTRNPKQWFKAEYQSMNWLVDPNDYVNGKTVLKGFVASLMSNEAISPVVVVLLKKPAKPRTQIFTITRSSFGYGCLLLLLLLLFCCGCCRVFCSALSKDAEQHS